MKANNKEYRFPNHVERNVGFLTVIGASLFCLAVLGYKGPSGGEESFAVGICLYGYVLASSVKQFVYLLDNMYPGYEVPSIPYLMCCTFVGGMYIFASTGSVGFASATYLLVGILCVKHAWDCSYYD